MTSFLLACACLGSVDFVVRESSAQAPQAHVARPVAWQRAPSKPAAPLLAHTHQSASR
ncbi:hypothetical protein [Hymenobacter glaciei]|uniref:hypothetical protein n=1 Tax=Hymenobacter glaciei TaxID=877209 RepID=UPI0031EDBC46